MAQQTRSGTSDIPGTFYDPTGIGWRGRTGNAVGGLGYDYGYDTGYSAGYTAGYATGYGAGASSVGTSFPSARATLVAVGAHTGAIVGTSSYVVSPDAATEPGDPGGFPADPTAAAATPIVIEIDDATFVVVTARRGAGDEELVYRSDGFRGAFGAGSFEEQVSPTRLRLHILPDGGWLADVVIAVDAYNVVASSRDEFGWFLPRASAEVIATPVADGSLDFVAEAFDHLPWRLASVEVT